MSLTENRAEPVDSTDNIAECDMPDQHQGPVQLGIQYGFMLQQRITLRLRRFYQNVERVISLMNSYSAAAGPRSKSAPDDILRAAVVLLHASLEDFLRVLAQAY